MFYLPFWAKFCRTYETWVDVVFPHPLWPMNVQLFQHHLLKSLLLFMPLNSFYNFIKNQLDPLWVLCSVDLCVYFLANSAQAWLLKLYNKSWESGKLSPFTLFFLKTVLATLSPLPLYIYIHSRIILSVKVKALAAQSDSLWPHGL